jgi:hypothetical protein
VWSKSGFKDLKHLSERVSKHGNCASHIDNAVKLELLGKSNILAQQDTLYIRAIDLYNKQMEENRYVLARIIMH